MPEPVATTTVTPAAAPVTPTPTPTAEQLAAAITGQPPVATQTASGYRYEIAPNVVFEGATPEEAIDKMVAGLKKREEFIGTLKSENQQLRSSTQPRDESGRFTPAQQQAADTKFNQQEYFNRLTEDPLSAQRMALAALFNIPEDQVVATLNRTVQAAGMAADNLLVTSFLTECPDFPHENDNAFKELVNMVDAMGGAYTPKSMKAAHKLCIDENKYTPMQTIGVEVTPATRPTPLPVAPQSGAHEPTQDIAQMAERMSASQIREAIAKIEQQGVK